MPEITVAILPSGRRMSAFIFGRVPGGISTPRRPSWRAIGFCMPPGTSSVGKVAGFDLLSFFFSSSSLRAASASSSKTAAISLTSSKGRSATKAVCPFKYPLPAAVGINEITDHLPSEESGILTVSPSRFLNSAWKVLCASSAAPVVRKYPWRRP